MYNQSGDESRHYLSMKPNYFVFIQNQCQQLRKRIEVESSSWPFSPIPCIRYMGHLHRRVVWLMVVISNIGPIVLNFWNTRRFVKMVEGSGSQRLLNTPRVKLYSTEE